LSEAPPATPLVLDLDDERSLDPSVSGAKAAWLAYARSAGLPVLPGRVVTTAASRPAMALGAETMRERGSGGARLVVTRMDLDPELLGGLEAAADVAPELVVRSSSLLEGGGEWAGAFTSYVGVGPDDVPLAVRGCWASAFSVHTLERYEVAGIVPGSTPMAVLIQPLLLAAFGGTARLDGEDVSIVAVAGSPAALLQGWEPGATARVAVDGTVAGPAAQLVGESTLRRIAAELRRAADAVGASTCEWALDTDDGITLLQVGRSPVTADSQLEVHPDLALPAAARIASLTRRFPGPIGEELVLPWAVSILGDPPQPSDVGVPVERLVDEIVMRSEMLAAAVWGRPPLEARREAAAVLSGLRGQEPGAALARIGGLAPADEGRAAELLGVLEAAREALVEAGAVSRSELAWHIGVEEARRILAGDMDPLPRRRFGFGVWEPFNAAVVLGTGERLPGVAAVPGVGCGRLRFLRDTGGMTRFVARDVVVARYPLPNWAQLLWDAAAVVTLGGGPGAHLFESARALAIPAVCGVHLEDTLGMPLEEADGRYAIAVDGTNGIVALTEW